MLPMKRIAVVFKSICNFFIDSCSTFYFLLSPSIQFRVAVESDMY